jgi:hypothetical protein
VSAARTHQPLISLCVSRPTAKPLPRGRATAPICSQNVENRSQGEPAPNRWRCSSRLLTTPTHAAKLLELVRCSIDRLISHSRVKVLLPCWLQMITLIQDQEVSIKRWYTW